MFNGVILTPSPKEGDVQHWDWWQRNIVYMGKPFRYSIGLFRYKLNQISKFEILRIEDQIMRGDVFDYIIDNSIPDNALSKLAGYDIKQDLHLYHTPADFMKGVRDEFLLMLRTTKKKMLEVCLTGVIPRGEKTQLTKSQKQSMLQKTFLLKHIGTDIFGIP